MRLKKITQSKNREGSKSRVEENFCDGFCFVDFFDSIVSAQVNNAYDGATTVTSQIRLFFVYDRDKREAVWIKSQDDYLVLKRDASRAGGSAMVKAAEMAYYLATSGEKFFGFSSDFYPDL